MTFSRILMWMQCWTQSQGHDQGLLFKDQDKDKDLSSKDKNKDKDCIVKDKDQDKDCILVQDLKESLRTRTRTNITAYTGFGLLAKSLCTYLQVTPISHFHNYMHILKNI